MARLKTRIRRRRQRDGESGLTKAERTEWIKEWQQELMIWDQVGFAVAALCVAMPVLLAFVPTVQTLFANFNVHAWLAGIALFITFATFFPSFLQHRRCRVLALALIGLSVISLAAINDNCCQVPRDNCAVCQTGQTCPQPEHTARMPFVDRTPTSDLPDVGVRATQTLTPDLSLASLWRQWQTPFGGALLAIAHVLNARCRRLCSGECRVTNQHDAPASDRRARCLEPLAGASG